MIITIRHIAIFTIVFAVMFFTPAMIMGYYKRPKEVTQDEFISVENKNIKNKYSGKEIFNMETYESGTLLVINFTDNSSIKLRSHKHPIRISE